MSCCTRADTHARLQGSWRPSCILQKISFIIAIIIIDTCTNDAVFLAHVPTMNIASQVDCYCQWTGTDQHIPEFFGTILIHLTIYANNAISIRYSWYIYHIATSRLLSLWYFQEQNLDQSIRTWVKLTEYHTPGNMHVYVGPFEPTGAFLVVLPSRKVGCYLL